MDSAAPQKPAPHSLDDASLIRALRVAAHLARGQDWPGLRDQFLDHPFRPLAKLSGGAADALLCFEPLDIGPDQILLLCWPANRDEIADLFGIFGMLE